MAKAEVCKTFIRRFESARRLHPIRYFFWVMILSLATAIGCASVQPPPSFEGQSPSRPVSLEQVPLITLMLWHARDLALTPTQIQALDRLRSNFQREAELQAAELQRMELELQRVLSGERIDLAQVEARMRKMEALRTDFRMSRIRTIEKGKALLTPEQWRKLQPLVRGGP